MHLNSPRCFDRIMVTFMHHNTVPRPSDYQWFGFRSASGELIVPTLILKSKPLPEFMHRRNREEEDKWSYHAALPFEASGKSRLHNEALELMFPSKHPLRQYVDFNIYSADTHNLRAPLCDKVHPDSLLEGRALLLDSIWYWDDVDNCPARHIEAEQYFGLGYDKGNAELEEGETDLRMERLYCFSSLRVNSCLNPATQEIRTATVIRGLLKDCGVTARYNKLKALQISQRRQGGDGRGQIDLEDSEFPEFSTDLIDRISSQVGLNVDDKKSQIVKYINRYFGVVDSQGDSKNIIQKVWCDVSRCFDIKYTSFENLAGIYCNCVIGVPKDKPNQAGEFEVMEVEVFKMWRVHPLKRIYMGVVFNAIPGFYHRENNPLAPRERAFNMFSRENILSLDEMRMRYNNCLYRADVIPWFVQVVLCKYDYFAYDTLTRLLLTKILRPEKRTALSIMIHGAQGTGKSLFLESYARLFGRHSLVTYSDDDFSGKFNALLEGKIFVYCNESDRRRSKGNTGTSKALKSQNYLVVEHKGKDRYRAHNYLMLASDTNHKHALNIDLDGRRDFVLQVLDSMIGQKPFYTELARQLEMHNQGRTYIAAWLYEEYLRVGEKGLDEFDCGHNWGEGEMTVFTNEQRLLSTTGPEGVFIEWVKRGYHVHPNAMTYRVHMRSARLKKGDAMMYEPRFIDEPEKHPFWCRAVAFDDLYQEYVSTVSSSVGTENGHSGKQQHTKNLFKTELASFFNIRSDTSTKRSHVKEWLQQSRTETLFTVPRELGNDAKVLVVYFQLSLTDQRKELRIKKRGLPFDQESTAPQLHRGQKRSRDEADGDQQHSDDEQQALDDEAVMELTGNPGTSTRAKVARTEAWERRKQEEEGVAGNPLLAGFDVKVETHFPKLDDDQLMPANGPWRQDATGKDVLFDPFLLGFRGYEKSHPPRPSFGIPPFPAQLESVRYLAYKQERGLGELDERDPAPAPAPALARVIAEMEDGDVPDDDL